jgi:hypothetical protein
VRATKAKAAISHLRENIRIRSPSNLYCEMPGQRKSGEKNPVLKKPATILPEY